MNLVKNLTHPRSSAYKLSTAARRAMPVPLAKLLAVGNRTAGAVKLPTYDGSGQACHPTTAVFQGKTYMACTPYPYGGEAYENPSLYVQEGNSWRPVPGAFPLVRPQQPGFEHYSDPCLFQMNGLLVLLFRKCERRKDGKKDFLFTSASENGADWTRPRLLTEGRGDSLISPGAAGGALFCVEYDGRDTGLVRYEFNDLSGLGRRTVCGTEGLEQSFFVWHMDCATLPDGTVRGLFMLQKKSAVPTQSKLALFRWLPEEGLWRWERDLPPEKNGNISFVYKSCFMGEEGRFLCSACDRKGRFFLYEASI